MFGDLRPWITGNLFPDGHYKPETRTQVTIKPAFTPGYRLTFIRHISGKTQYYKKLIDNDLTQYCNTLFQQTHGKSHNLQAFRKTKALGELHAQIKELSDIITIQQFNLKYITPQHTGYPATKPLKEATYIIYYLLSAFIKTCLEIQHHYRQLIHEDDIMEIADFYTRILQQTPPQNTWIKQIQAINIEPDTENTPGPQPTPAIPLSFTYKHLQKQSGNITDLFNSLKKNNRIHPATSITDFKHAFSGTTVQNPVRWTGAKSELPYLIKLLCNTHQVLEYKGSLWKTVCACFTDKDGNPYAENNLKDQKKPKTTAAAIEKMAALMK